VTPDTFFAGRQDEPDNLGGRVIKKS